MIKNIRFLFEQLIGLQIQQKIDHENPLLETNELEPHEGEIWLKGNFTLLNLNLSRKNTNQNLTKIIKKIFFFRKFFNIKQC